MLSKYGRQMNVSGVSVFVARFIGDDVEQGFDFSALI
jgi:hypothetical protein